MLNINNNFVFRQIKQTDDTAKLSLGKPSYIPLKIFLKKHAFDFHQYDIAKTYVLINPELSHSRVWGYMSLMNSEVILNEDQRPKETFATMKYKVYPAIKIARLALDKSLHGQGLGMRMLDWCVSNIQVGIMPEVGCRFLVVDSKRESISFYQRAGFKMLNRKDNLGDEYPHMFFDLHESKQPIKNGVCQNKSSAVVSI